VLRILDREKSIVPLEQMGFTDTPARTATDDGAAGRHPGGHRRPAPASPRCTDAVALNNETSTS
jgi:hypothetical protein